MNIEISQDQKISVLGDFKTGKTTLCEVILSSFPRWMAFDAAHRMHAPPELVAQTPAEALRLFDSGGRSILRPREADLEAPFDAWSEGVLTRSNLMSYVDEPTLVLQSTGRIPDGFSRIYRVGHARGIGCMMGTHRYSGDLPALTRIRDHLFCFRMTVNADVESLADEMGWDAAEYVKQQPDRFFFYKGNNGMQAFNPLPEAVALNVAKALSKPPAHGGSGVPQYSRNLHLQAGPP